MTDSFPGETSSPVPEVYWELCTVDGAIRLHEREGQYLFDVLDDLGKRAFKVEDIYGCKCLIYVDKITTLTRIDKDARERWWMFNEELDQQKAEFLRRNPWS